MDMEVYKGLNEAGYKNVCMLLLMCSDFAWDGCLDTSSFLFFNIYVCDRCSYI